MRGYIYKITNVVNNKIYIGQTIKTIQHRWNQHKRNARYSTYNKDYDHHLARAILKYGISSFRVETVEIILSSNKDELASLLNKREIYYISYYDSYNNGYNSTTGGTGSSGLIEERSGNAKILLQYDLDGNLIKEWSCLSKASKFTGVCEDSLRKVANGYTKYCHKLECVWRWKNDPKNLPIIVDVDKVIQYDLNNNVVTIWNSYSTIQRIFGETFAKGVNKVCNGYRSSYKGFIWKYEKRINK